MAFSTTQKLFHAFLTPNLRDRVNTCYHLSFPRRKCGAPPMEPRLQFPDMSMLLQRAGLHLYYALLQPLLAMSLVTLDSIQAAT